MDAAGMAAAGAPTLPPDDASPTPVAGHGAPFPIAIVIAVGFVVTSLILISYYFLVVRCWLRGGGVPGSGLLLHRADLVEERVSAVFFTDLEAAAELPGGGLDPDVVAALPVVKYRRARAASAALECAVCLAEFAPEERLKQLPGCSHAFHVDCIDTWLHHNVSCPLCRTVVIGGVPLSRDDHEALCRDPQVGDDRRIIGAAAARARMGYYGSSCRFPTKIGNAEEPITRSFSMDCFAGGLGRKPPQKDEDDPTGSSDEAGPSRAAADSSSNVVADRGAGDTSGRFRLSLSSFGLGRSSVLPIHLDPRDGGGGDGFVSSSQLD